MCLHAHKDHGQRSNFKSPCSKIHTAHGYVHVHSEVRSDALPSKSAQAGRIRAPIYIYIYIYAHMPFPFHEHKCLVTIQHVIAGY